MVIQEEGDRDQGEDSGGDDGDAERDDESAFGGGGKADPGMDATPNVVANRRGVIPEAVAEQLVKPAVVIVFVMVVVTMHTFWVVVLFFQSVPGGFAGLSATGCGWLRGLFPGDRQSHCGRILRSRTG